MFNLVYLSDHRWSLLHVWFNIIDTFWLIEYSIVEFLGSLRKWFVLQFAQMVISFFLGNNFRVIVIVCNPWCWTCKWSVLSYISNFGRTGLEVTRLCYNVAFFIFEVFDYVNSLSSVLIWWFVWEFNDFWGTESFFMPSCKYFLIVLLPESNHSSNIFEGFSNSIVGGCLTQQSAINCRTLFDGFSCYLFRGSDNITFLISTSCK